MKSLVAFITDGHQVIWGIAASLTALQVMGVEFYTLTMSTTTLTGITIAEENILTHIVEAVHLSLLVVLALRHRHTICDRLEQLQVKLGSLNNYLTDWQELKARLILVICSWILTSTDGASQPLCLLWTRLLNRGWR